MEKVLLFKSPENSEIYESVLESNQYVPLFIPVLDFVFTNLDELLLKLKDHDKYFGLVITSPRAVDALNKCVNSCATILRQWKTKHIFVIGEATNRKLNCQLELSGCGLEAGNANALADYIIQQNSADAFIKPLLFPCGNLRSEIMPAKLAAENIQLDSIVVYNTKMHEHLKDNIIKLKDCEGIPLNLIFFSPSGVDFVVPILKDIGYNFDKSKLVSIGSSTEKKIMQLGLTVFATAKEPTPLAISSCLGGLEEHLENIKIK